MLNVHRLIFNIQFPKGKSPLIAAIHRPKIIGYRIVFTHVPNISLFCILIYNSKSINFIIH